MIRNHETILSSAACFFVALLIYAPDSGAGEHASADEEQQSRQTEVTTLEERLLELTQRHETLVLENENLQDELYDATGWEPPYPLDIREILENTDEYQFLELGAGNDYMAAERARRRTTIFPQPLLLGRRLPDRPPEIAPGTGGRIEIQPTKKGPEPPQPSLRRLIAQLEYDNWVLETENEELRARQSKRIDTAKTAPIDVPESKPSDDDLDFLDLGTTQDYLKAERHRIRDQIRSFIPPLYEPVRPFHAYTLPPGAWRVSIKNRSFWNNSDFGRDDHYAKLFEDVKVRSHTVHLSILHGFELPFASDLTLAVDIPYRKVNLSGDGRPFRNDFATVSMDGDGGGIGDITVTLKKKWIDQGNFPVSFATFTGVIFPTGKDDLELDRDQKLIVGGMRMPDPPLNIFGRKMNDRLLPPGLQAGQGVWGLRLGGAVTRQFTRSALHAGVIVDLLADNDGITPGDEYKFGVSYVFPPFKSDDWAVDLSVFGRYKGDSKFPGTGILGPRANFKNGTVAFFSPSIIYTPNPQTRFFVSPEFRILEPNRGPSPEFALTAGFSFTW